MNTSFRISMDSRLSCYASERKGDICIQYFLGRSRISLSVSHNYKEYRKMSPETYKMFQDISEEEVLQRLVNFLENHQSDSLFDANLGLGNALNIQLLDSDKPTKTKRVLKKKDKAVKLAGERVFIRKNNVILFEQILTENSEVFVSVSFEKEGYVLFIGYWERTKEEKRTKKAPIFSNNYPLNVDDSIKISFDRYHAQESEASLPHMKTAG